MSRFQSRYRCRRCQTVRLTPCYHECNGAPSNDCSPISWELVKNLKNPKNLKKPRMPSKKRKPGKPKLTNAAVISATWCPKCDANKGAICQHYRLNYIARAGLVHPERRARYRRLQSKG